MSKFVGKFRKNHEYKYDYENPKSEKKNRSLPDYTDVKRIKSQHQYEEYMAHYADEDGEDVYDDE